MKSYNHVFDEIISLDNLTWAIERASLGKRDQRDVKYCLRNKVLVANRLQYLLLTNQFVPSEHSVRVINDGVKQKKRKIVCPRYMYEQIVHNAIVQVISPIFEKSLYKYSCASIPGRGVHMAKRHIETFIRKHPDKSAYVLKLDIRKFFPSIDHGVLKAMLQKKFHDWRFLRLMDTILDNYHDRTHKGLPIGFYTSQWLANWYLYDLDHYIKQVLGASIYVRYNDDMIILDNDKRRLHGFKRQIESYLLHEKDLVLNHKWQVFKLSTRPLDFAGFRFHVDGHVTLRRSIMLRGARKAKRMRHVTWYSASQMLCYLAWFKSCDAYGIYHKHIKPYVSKRTLRACVSHHFKRINHERNIELAEVVLDAAS